jgi:glutamine synthetase
MTVVDEVLTKIKDQNIKFVDFRFTDTLGVMHNITYDSVSLDNGIVEKGVIFNGSLVKGWHDVAASDMLLKPDPSSFFIDPFATLPTAVILCSVLCINTMQDYNRDPRSIALRAERYLSNTAIANEIYFETELEFYLFDDVRYYNDANKSGFEVDSEELGTNSAKHYNSGNHGHRQKDLNSHFPSQPVDTCSNVRAEIADILSDVGIRVKHLKHEASAGQNQIGLHSSTLLNFADNIQKAKYIIKNVASSYGKTATFMPKPTNEGNGSSMSLQQYMFKGGKNLFFGKYFQGLSSEALFYLGGIMKHSRALNAFTNPTTNSYKRLANLKMVPNIISYSDINRSTPMRIPYAATANEKRVEVIYPDPSANPYLALSAMMMAGLNGILNRIHPGDPEVRNLFELSMKERSRMPKLSSSLEESIKALDHDREFLLQGRVFTSDQIDSYIKLKRKEVEDLRSRPHPIEFKNYYSC